VLVSTVDNGHVYVKHSYGKTYFRQMKTHILRTKLFVHQPWHGVNNILKQTNRQEYYC